ncbi:MAG: acetyltransferase [Candidatus Cloacimonetes bacterium]|nr:acetyltransferase [Candidatus Cloacimonadota bacterium]
MSDKKNIIIVGAGGFGRELESWIESDPQKKHKWIIKGYLHDFKGKNPLENYQTDYRVLGSFYDYQFDSDDYCLIAISDWKWKKEIYNSLLGKVKILTYIDSRALVGKFSEIGEGSVICPFVAISTDVRIGKCVTINVGTQIGHDCRIGSFTSIMSQVEIGGHCNVGERVFIGSHANIIPQRHIGDDAFVGAGSVIISNIKAGKRYFGNPAIEIPN